MPLQLANRVKESSSTSGSGVITLSGADNGYQSFSAVLSNGDTTYYTIVNANNWEVGLGTYNSNSLTRDTILSSSNSNNPLELSGTSSVFIAYPSEKSVYKDSNNQVIVGSSGIILESGIPSNTSSVIYNTGGVLYFNGSLVVQSGDNVSLLANDAGYISELSQDTSPQLGGDLDLNSSSITGVGDVEINGTVSGINGVFNSGVILNSSIPSVTSNTIYNNSGVLYFDNTTVGSIRSYENISNDTSLDISTDIAFIDSTLNEVNLDVPIASGNGGKEIKIKRVAGDNLVTVNASGLGNIDGSTSFVIHHLYQSITIVSNNLNWFIT